jgi:hypothetical protein
MAPPHTEISKDWQCSEWRGALRLDFSATSGSLRRVGNPPLDSERPLPTGAQDAILPHTVPSFTSGFGVSFAVRLDTFLPNPAVREGTFAANH